MDYQVTKTTIFLSLLVFSVSFLLYKKFFTKKKPPNTGLANSFIFDLEVYFECIKTSAEEMIKNTKEISTNTNSAAKMARNTLERFQEIEDVVEKLNRSSEEIGEILNFVSNIAQQTNLLALNASIEAARAGDAGKGFAVVADEVKELSKQTKHATKEIKRKIEIIQLEIGRVENSVGNTTGSITDLNNINQTIALALEKQKSFNTEIAVSIGEADSRIKEV